MSVELESVFHETTFSASDLAQLPYDEVRQAVGRHGFVRICGLFDRRQILAARGTIERQFDRRHDRKHDPADTEAVRTNFQKLQVGGVTAINTCARFLRMLYNPIFAEDIYGMRAHFVRLARFRNRLYGIPEDFAIHGTDDGLWTASRVHQYPTGGGFMAAHADITTAAVAVEAGFDFYLQVALLMSRKGEDFQAGGAFIEYDGQTLQYEDACDVGDVIVYDGRIVHGVADIDPLQPLDMDTFSGRTVAFVTLFKHLRPHTSDYDDLKRHWPSPPHG